MKRLGIALLALCIICTAADKPTGISAGQSIYIVAMDTSTRDSNLSADRLELERKAREQFVKEKKFKIVPTVRSADLVFVIAIDNQARDYDEIAVVVAPDVYLHNASNLEALRNAALWQSDAHLHRGKEAAIAAASVGYSTFFRHPSVVKDLVKRFHKEAL